MDRLMRDVRYALRRLGRTPGFTAIAVVSLALGIGANTAIFSLVNAVFFRDSGVAAPERVLELYRSSDTSPYSAVAYRDYLAIVERGADVFERAAVYSFFPVRLEAPDGMQAVTAEMVGGDYFGTYGLVPLLGRGFTAAEVEPSAGQAVAVVSHDFWRDAMGARGSAVGEQVRLNGRSYTVIGVMAPTFRGKTPGFEPAVWTPLGMRAHLQPGLGDADNLWMSARLRPGIEAPQGIAAVRVIAEGLNQERREQTGSAYQFGFAAVPLSEVTFYPAFDGMLAMIAALLMTAVGLVLLVACTNLASFLLARDAERRREVAIRLSLGADRGTLVRQLMTESIVLSFLGGLAGLVVAAALVGLVLRIRPPIGLSITLDASLDVLVLCFTAGISVLAGVLFGLAPALRSTRTDLVQTMREEAAGVIGGGGRVNLRNALVVVQVAFSLLLLICAGLFARSLQQATRVDVGFSTGPGAVMTVDAATSGYTDEQIPRLYDELLRRSAEAAGVTRVAITSKMPLMLGTQRRTLTVPGVAPPPERDGHLMNYSSVSPDYFDVMGTPLLRGRAFTADDDADAPRVAIVSAAAAAQFWPGEEAVGKIVYWLRDDTPIRVVGVAGNIKLTRLTEGPVPYMYVPFLQDAGSRLYLLARGSAPAPQLVSTLRTAIRELDADLFVPEARTMAEHMGLILYLPRMAAALLSGLGALALLLAVIGLYGVVSYGVSRRTREVGVRMSLGATPGSVVLLLMRGGLLLATIGAAAGILLALAGTRFVRSLLIDVGATDPVTFILVPLLLAGVAALAAYLPARKASGVHPMQALRTD